ncbi:MAG TPA: hypothetical protein VEY70_10220 [Metabacillus sp.]|nr:hypothetical protein [Metabacillus sp.]
MEKLLNQILTEMREKFDIVEEVEMKTAYSEVNQRLDRINAQNQNVIAMLKKIDRNTRAGASQ